MGPHAGVELARLCVSLADCSSDQEHPDILLVSRPGSLADRSEFLTGRSEANPAAGITSVVRELAGAGATVIGLACNTSHAPEILDPVRQALSREYPQVALLSLVKCGAQAALSLGRGQPVGLLATEGAYQSRVYEAEIASLGSSTIIPVPSVRKRVHQAIYHPEWGIKRQSNPVGVQVKQELHHAASELRSAGAGTIILGCTEFALVSDIQSICGIPAIDPMRELAIAMLRVVECPVRADSRSPQAGEVSGWWVR